MRNLSSKSNRINSIKRNFKTWSYTNHTKKKEIRCNFFLKKIFLKKKYIIIEYVLFLCFQVTEKEGASIAAAHSIGFCEVSVAENSSNLYKAFEKLLMDCRARPVKQRKFSVSKMFGTLMGNGSSNNHNTLGKQTPIQSGTVVPCHKGELHKSRIVKRRQAYTTAASLWPTTIMEVE